MIPDWLICGVCRRKKAQCDDANAKVAPEFRHVFRTVDQVRREDRQKRLDSRSHARLRGDR